MKKTKTEIFKEFNINSVNDLKEYIHHYVIKSDGRTNYFAIEAQLDKFKQYAPNCLGQQLAEYVYWILNDLIDYPICVICGNQITSFRGIKCGYIAQTCSNKCQGLLSYKNMNEETKIETANKIRDKLLSKSSDEWKEITSKRKHTNLAKYGYECANSNLIVRNKTIETNNIRYGGPAPLCSAKIREKSKQTCIKKYGTEFHTQSNKVKEKIRDTNRKRYGVDWHTQSSNFKDKTKDTCKRKYSVDNPSKNAHIKSKKRITTNSNYGVDYGFFLNRPNTSFSNKSNVYFETIYDQLHEDDQDCTYTAFLNDTEFNIIDKIYNRCYFYDFVCTSLKICIEFQGDYWHMNPKKYAPMEWNPSREMFAFEIWEYDKRKRKVIEELGYSVTYVWESEIIQHH